MILDTNAVSSLLAGNNEQLNAVLKSAARHHLPLAVIAEYQFGLPALHRPRRLQSLLRRRNRRAKPIGALNWDRVFEDNSRFDLFLAIESQPPWVTTRNSSPPG